MSLPLSCVCGARFEVEEAFSGQSVACPECQQSIKVPLAGRARLRTSGYALASVVLALVGMFTIVLSAIAVVLGFIGLTSIARHRDQRHRGFVLKFSAVPDGPIPIQRTSESLSPV